MSLKITTLVENTQGEHLTLKNEHGISFLIETESARILFDTGQSDTIIRNAGLLKLDLEKLDYVVLSHGHYDHSGGFRHIAEIAHSFRLIMGEGFFNEKYAVCNSGYEFLGNDFDETFLNDSKIPYEFAHNQLTEIAPRVYVITAFNRTHEDEVINSRFVIRKEHGFDKDTFNDEVMMAIDTDEGLVLVLGCSHPGMKNMLETARSLLKRPVKAVLGGTHLVESGEKSLKASIDYLINDDIPVIGVSHCTGPLAMDHLKEAGQRFFHNRTGSSLFIE